MTIAWVTAVVREAVRLRARPRTKRYDVRSASGLCRLLGMRPGRANRVANRNGTRRNQEARRSLLSERVLSNAEGEGYDFEGRFGVHASERDLTWHMASYQPAGDRRERLGRVRCPFAIPRDHEALRFDL